MRGRGPSLDAAPVSRLLPERLFHPQQTRIGHAWHGEFVCRQELQLAENQFQHMHRRAGRALLDRQLDRADDQFLQQRRDTHQGRLGRHVRGQVGDAHPDGAKRDGGARPHLVFGPGRHPKRPLRRDEPVAAGGADLHHAGERVDELRPLVRMLVVHGAARIGLRHRGDVSGHILEVVAIAAFLNAPSWHPLFAPRPVGRPPENMLSTSSQ